MNNILNVPNSHWDTSPIDDYLANHHEGCICQSCYDNVLHHAEREFMSWFPPRVKTMFEYADLSSIFRDLWENGEVS